MSTALPDLLERHARPRPLWLRVLCVIGAVFFFLLGLIGWLVPVVTGIPFYVLSLILLGMASDRVRERINQMERKLPERWRAALRRALGRRARRRAGGS
jgi:uncharacterized membrane protein YbaN (DUF454 family)